MKTTHNLCTRLLCLGSDLNACIPGIQGNRNGTGLVKESLSHLTQEHKIFYLFCTFPSLEILTANKKASKVALKTDKNHIFERHLFCSDKEMEPQ